MHAATLQIASNVTTLAPGDTATLLVTVDSQGVAINNAQATINFPAALLSVVSVNSASSIFSLWVQNPTFSNTAGTITFNGGVPTPGYTGASGAVVAILVRAKQAGQANLVFSSDDAVRANDGLGTNVLNGQKGVALTIGPSAAPTPVAPVAPVAPTPPPPTTSSDALALQISSPTHPNQDQWYNNSSPEFQWVLPDGVDEVQTTIDNTTSGVPHVIYNPATTQKTVTDLADGVWYFKIRAHNENAWGPVSTYIARIDTTAPQENNAVFSYDDTAKVLTMSAQVQDITSGIDHYDIYINDALVKTISAADFAGGSYALPFDASGDNTVKLVAVDRAGNSASASGSFHATAILVPQLSALPRIVPANQPLLISGVAQSPNTTITINVKHNFDNPVALQTTSGSDSSFSVATSPLAAGDYTVWAEAGSGNAKVSSARLYTTATSQLLITIGSHTFVALNFGIIALLILIVLLLAAYFLGRHHANSESGIRIRSVLLKDGTSKVLLLLKKRLEKHLEILQNLRHDRILTKAEKEIKEAIEVDLDEVDEAIEEQKAE